MIERGRGGQPRPLEIVKKQCRKKASPPCPPCERGEGRREAVAGGFQQSTTPYLQISGRRTRTFPAVFFFPGADFRGNFPAALFFPVLTFGETSLRRIPPPLRGPPPFHKGAKLPQSQFRQPKEGGAVSPALSAVSYRFFSRPVASLNSLMSSSSSLAWAWTASQVPLVSYHKSLRSWTSLACCSTQV